MKLHPIAWVLVFYGILSLFFTYPLVLHLSTSLPGNPMDAFLYLWNIDTFWLELSGFNNPFFTDRIFYPVGTNLIFHTYAPLVSLFGLAFLNNLVLYFNILVLASLATTAFSMFLLMRYITRNIIASFLAGLVFGFSPIMLSFIASQHYYFVFAASLLPIGILFLLRFLDSLKIKFLIAMIGTVWIVFFIDYYSTVFLSIMLAIITIVKLVRDRKLNLNIFKSKKLKVYICASTLILVVPTIFLFSIIFRLSNLQNWITQRNEYFYSYCNTNIVGFFIPSEKNPMLWPIAQALQEKTNVPRNYDTPSYFLGWTIFLLAVVSFIKFGKTSSITTALGISGIFILLLSLGTSIKFGPVALLSGASTPFWFFSHLPFMGLIDCPLRFPIGTQLSLAALVGILAASKLKKKSLLFIIGFILLFTIEYGQWGMEVSQVKIPSVYHQLASIPGNRTVLELPSGITESKGGFGYDWSINALHAQQSFWQTIHKKPRIGGYVSRASERIYTFYKKGPVIADLFTMTSLNGEWPGRNYTTKEINSFIKQFNLGFVILSPNPRKDQFARVIEDLFNNFIERRFDLEGFTLYSLE